MNNLETLLNNELYDGKVALTVNTLTRELEYDGTLVLGVRDDHKAKQIYFEFPKIVGDDIDLSSNDVSIYINIEQGSKQTTIYECTDKAQTGESIVKFSWMVTQAVTSLVGTVKFNVCVKKTVNGEITREWHTLPATGTVLEGVDVDNETPEIAVDPQSSIAELMNKVDSINAYTKEHIDETFATKEYVANTDSNTRTYVANTYATKEQLAEITAKNEALVVVEGEDIVLAIDEPNRAIKYNKKLILGVEGDYKGKKIYFSAPKEVGDNIEIMDSHTKIYIDYKNAVKEPYFTESSDKVLDEKGEIVKFSWVLADNVSATKGTVKFRVRFSVINDEGQLTNEWCTSLFEGTILEGIDVSSKDAPEVITDQTTTSAQVLARMDEMETLFNNVTHYTKQEADDRFATIESTNNQIDNLIDDIDTNINNTINSLTVNGVSFDNTNNAEIYAKDIHLDPQDEDPDGVNPYTVAQKIQEFDMEIEHTIPNTYLTKTDAGDNYMTKARKLWSWTNDGSQTTSPYNISHTLSQLSNYNIIAVNIWYSTSSTGGILYSSSSFILLDEYFRNNASNTFAHQKTLLYNDSDDGNIKIKINGTNIDITFSSNQGYKCRYIYLYGIK